MGASGRSGWHHPVRVEGTLRTLAGVEEAWEAYRSGPLPIGAVVTDAHGNVLSRGRNRIHERSGPSGAVFDHKLAHAELNALLSLDHREYDPHACVLWTTTEPCPLCVGAARMSEVSGLRYAAREPWGDPRPCSRPCPTYGERTST